MSVRASRRQFLKSAIGASLIASAGCSVLRARRDSRPNLLIVLADEHAASVLGCYGDPVAETPHLDRLAGEGVLFESAYCNAPVCGPSRESWLSGRYTSSVALWGNSSWLPAADTPTWTSALRAAGYDVRLSGKMHLDRTRRYGMDELWPSHANQHFKSGKGTRRGAQQLSSDSELWRKRSAHFSTSERSVVLQHDVTAIDAALGFLATRRLGDPPFALIVGLIAPHFPLTVPEKWYRRFAGRIPPPNIAPGEPASLPLNYRLYRSALGPADGDEAREQRGRECYWALVSWVDDQIGRLLAGLEQSRVAEQTATIYCSDHGENKGDHGMWWKGSMFESSTRIPLIARWPGAWLAGARVREAVSLVDLNATVCELGGVEPLADANGFSLAPRLTRPTTALPDRAVSEYYGHYIASGTTMYRTGRWKYVYHAASPEHGPALQQLYDLSSDPHEDRDLGPTHPEIPRVHRELVAQLGSEPDAIEAQCRAEITVGYKRTPPAGRTGADSPDREEGLD